MVRFNALLFNASEASDGYSVKVQYSDYLTYVEDFALEIPSPLFALYPFYRKIIFSYELVGNFSSYRTEQSCASARRILVVVRVLDVTRSEKPEAIAPLYPNVS